MALTDARKNLMLDAGLKDGAPMYLALGTSVTTELAGAGGYARRLIPWTTAVAGVEPIASPVLFGPNTGADWTITHVLFYSLASGGTLEKAAALSRPCTVSVDQSFRFSIGNLTATIE